MAVTRGSKITKATLDALALKANGKAALEGRPYQFMPRIFYINDSLNLPPWSSKSRERLAGIQVGDVVVNIRRPLGNIALKQRYADIYKLNRAISNVQATVAADWVSLRSATPAWRIVHDFGERDSNEITNPADPNFGYGLLTAGNIADGTIIIVVIGPLQGDETQGNPDNWNFNNLAPAVEVRRSGTWHYCPGWLSELNRMRFAIGRKFSSVDPNVVNGPTFGPFGAIKASALISKVWALDSGPSDLASYLFVAAGIPPFATAPVGGWQFKDVEFWHTQTADVLWIREIRPKLTFVDLGGGFFRTGFVSDISPAGSVMGELYTNDLTVFGTKDGFEFPILDTTGTGIHVTVTGTLKPYCTVQLAAPSGGGRGTAKFKAAFNGAALPPGEWWLSVSVTVDSTIGPYTNCRLVFFPDLKFHDFQTTQDGSLNFRIYKEYSGSAPAKALHTSKEIGRRSFAGENVQTSRLPGSIPDADNPIVAGENSGNAYYRAVVPVGQSSITQTLARSWPLGSVSEVTGMDTGGRQFAPHQHDLVPPVNELVRSGSGQFTQSVADPVRGPTYGNARLFNHQPLAKVYPVVKDPLPIEQYVPFTNEGAKGQIIEVIAVRKGVENDSGTAVLEDNPEGSIDVEVGCYRNGVFTRLIMVQIAAGQNVGIWRADHDAGIPVVPVFEFYPLVVKCDEDVMVYPRWFGAQRDFGLGDGTLAESGNNLTMLKPIAPLLMADHFNETEALLNLI